MFSVHILVCVHAISSATTNVAFPVEMVDKKAGVGVSCRLPVEAIYMQLTRIVVHKDRWWCSEAICKNFKQMPGRLTMLHYLETIANTVRTVDSKMPGVKVGWPYEAFRQASPSDCVVVVSAA